MTHSKSTSGSLFPSARITSAETTSAHSESLQKLEWLENKSFTSETGQEVVKFQQKLKILQKKGLECDGDSDEDNGVLKRTDERRIITGAGSSKAAVNSARTIPDIHTENRQIPDTDRQLDTDGQQDRCFESDDCGYKRKKKQKKRSSSDDSDDHSKKKKSKHKKKHKKDKHKSKERREIEIPGLFDSNKIFLDDIADIAPDHAFKVDRKPDTNSWTYGSLYSGHVAKYKSDWNQCAGSHRYQSVNMIDRGKKKKEEIISERYYSKENRRMIKQPPVEVMSSSKQVNNEEADLSLYISLQDVDENASRIENMDIRQKILDDSTSLYIKGKSKQGADELAIREPSDPIRLKITDYNKRLRESPNNVKLWLEFVKFQDNLTTDDSSVRSEPGTDIVSKKQSAKSVLDKKLSILDKALESNPANIDLLLAKIELNSEISDTGQINNELEQLLFVHVANTRLWKYYLTFNQSRLAVFTVTKMTKHYHKCFKTLFGILEGQIQTHSVPKNFEREILEIYLQYCYFLKQAGYKEKAVASFQAQIEYNLFVPQSLHNVSKETKMAAFEEFWDSSCPKIGTTGAYGWKNWKEQSSPAIDSEESSTDPLEDMEGAIIEKKLSKRDTWLKVEELREQHHWLPWQPGQGQTEEECEDVERLVVFDDVSPVLFDISEHLHFEFLVSFLKFLGLETKGVCCVELSGFFSENVNEWTSDYQGTVIKDAISVPNNDFVINFIVEFLKLVIPCFREKKRSDLIVILIETQLSKYQRKSLSKYEKKEMKKVLKNVLKEKLNRDDLAVWSLYIDLERSIGKPGEGESVMETALSMYSGSSVESANAHTVGLISLFCQYCEMLLKMEHKMPYRLLSRSVVSRETKKRVLSVINTLVEGKKFNSREVTDLSGAAILKTLSALARLCSAVCKAVCCADGTCASELSQEHFIKLVWCHSLFAYCKSGLSSSIDIYKSVIKSLSSGDKHLLQVERRLYMDMLTIILYHMSTSSSPLHVLREILNTALQKFPENDIFLSLYVDVERKSRITSQFNSHFDRWCRTIEAPTPAMFAILVQLEVLTNLNNSGGETCHTSVVHRSRTWLERSLAFSTLQHCPLLWRLYVQLEKQAGSIGRLKGVFYRAIQQCPWNKSIYMDGVRLLGAEQLQEIVDLMTEKELRVQVPVEELDILTDF